MTLKEKEKKAHDYKKKYEQMMENMRKLVSFGVP